VLGKINEQCKLLNRTTELRKQLERETLFCHPAEFRLGESSDKLLSIKHTYQAELKDREQFKCTPLRGSEL